MFFLKIKDLFKHSLPPELSSMCEGVFRVLGQFGGVWSFFASTPFLGGLGRGFWAATAFYDDKEDTSTVSKQVRVRGVRVHSAGSRVKVSFGF